jgi:hypothetical protein
MNRTFPILLFVVTGLLVVYGTVFPAPIAQVTYVAGQGKSALSSATTPDGATQSLLDQLTKRDWHGAYQLVANQSEVKEQDFTRELVGTQGSLRTYATLEPSEVRLLKSSADEATVRARLRWATGLGDSYDTRDLKVVRQGSQWRVVWPLIKEVKVPPQVIPVNYLRWDVLYHGSEDDWTAQNAESPGVRITSMRAIADTDSTVVLGEVLNEDTVPAFVSVNATLVAKDGKILGQESSFDKISHVLLPKEVSPFRIDFPGVILGQIKSVKMEPYSALVPASADPVIGVLHQRLEGDALGRRVLAGELLNESGQTVEIAHVLATYYNNNGQIVWVSDAYLSQALLPQVPVPFTVEVPEKVAPEVATYRVTVNHFNTSRN